MPSISLLRPSSSCLRQPFARRWASTTARAIVYESPGDPASILRGISYELSEPKNNEIRVRFLASAINPADVNVLQGVYPSKPKPRENIASSTVHIPGNEGLAVVESLGAGAASSYDVGDWIIMAKPQLGTWSSHLNLPSDSVIRVPRSSQSSSGRRPIQETEAATLGVNPTTAYRMLLDFASLKPGDWIIQNAANSAVGLAAMQIAKSKGISSINLVRGRPDIDKMRSLLQSLGGDAVLSYDEIASKEGKDRIKEITSGNAPRLALNAVGGKPATDMMKLLGNDGQVVTYGGMSKKPVEIPTSLLIFKNISAHGFWMTNWYAECAMIERAKMIEDLATMIEQDKLQAPDTEFVQLSGSGNEIANIATNAVMKSAEGGVGKKFLLRFE